MIAYPEPCNVRYAAAYSFYSRDLTRYAASWEEQGDSFSFVLVHDFEPDSGRFGLQLEMEIVII